MSSPRTFPTPVQTPRSRRRWAALAVLMLPVLLVSVDNTVLAFALPAISSALRPSGTGLLWVIDAYPLVLAGLLIPMGSLGDRFGRRRMLALGSTGFALVSVAAAFSPTTEVLIATRAALGLFGAMLMPPTLSLLRSIFIDRNERRLAIAVWATAFAGGAALGPIVGGVLLEHFWWGSIFLIAVPILLPLLVLMPVLIPESKDPNPGRIDPVSIVLSLTTMAPLVYGIKSLATDGPNGVGVAALVVAVVSGVIFVRRQGARPDPMLDIDLFRRRSFSGAVLVNLLSVVAFVGFIFFISQHLQLVVGLSPVEASLVLVPGLLAMMLAGLGVVPIAKRVRPSIVVTLALCVSAVGYLLVALSAGEAPVWLLLVSFVVLSIGIGAAETVSNELIIATAPAAKVGAASAVSETAYEVGAVLGTAVLGTILTVSYRNGVEVPAGLDASDAASASETLGGAVAVAETLPADVAASLLESGRAAFDSGVALTSSIGVGLVLAAAAISAFFLRDVAAGPKGEDARK